MKKTGATLKLIHDEDYKIAEGYDVVFVPNLVSRNIYNTMLKANLKKAHSDLSHRLTIQPTYIIG